MPAIPAVRPPTEPHQVRLAAASSAAAPHLADDRPRRVRTPAAPTAGLRHAAHTPVVGPAAGGRANGHRVGVAPFVRPPAESSLRSRGVPAARSPDPASTAPDPASAAPHAPPCATPEPRLLDTAALPGHVNRLYRAAVALCGDPVDAQDLVQEVCLRALAKPRVIRGADDLPYLMQMLRNVFYNQCRSRAYRRTTPVEPEALTTVPAGRRHDPELGLLVREVHQAIAALPPHYRDVVVAVDVLGLAYADAATALGLAVGTVMSRLHRGRAGVARAVGEQAAS